MHNTIFQLTTSLRQLAAIGLVTTGIVGIGSPAFFVSTTAAEIYQFVGRDGSISLTNVPSDSRYRKIWKRPRRAVTAWIGAS